MKHNASVTEGSAPVGEQAGSPTGPTQAPRERGDGQRRTIWLIALCVVVANLVIGIAAGQPTLRDSDLDRIAGAVLPLSWLLGAVLLVPRRTRVLGQGLVRGAFVLLLLPWALMPLLVMFG